MNDSLSLRQVRRLAVARAGLLKPQWLELPARAAGSGKRARDAACRVVKHFGYLQLDTVSIAGARSHSIVLASRLAGFNPALGEQLLCADQRLFEYWGHEACWLPMALYPVFAFRRAEFDAHPWWGDVVREHPKVAKDLLRRIADEGAIRSLDMEGRGSRGWWDLKVTKRVADALWSCGELAIAKRVNFQRHYDLPERVIPPEYREHPLSKADALDKLLVHALQGHGWATTGTLASTWRLRNCRGEIEASLARLREAGRIVACDLRADKKRDGKLATGWLLAEDRELAQRLNKARPGHEQGVLLSPFDPLLWDRARVATLFGFEQLLEIYKPAPQRKYGYYCLPVLAGENLIGRVDLKAWRDEGKLQVLSKHYEPTAMADRSQAARTRAALASALQRYADAVGLRLTR